MEAAIRSSEQRFRLLVRSTAPIVWTLETGKVSEQGSNEWREFTGQTVQEMEEFGWLSAIHPEDRAKTEEAWAAAAEGRSVYEVEHRVRRRDGVYRFMRAQGVALPDAAGEIREWIGVHTDVSERRTLEAELRSANERFVLATRATTDGIWDLDCASQTVYYSARWRGILGLPQGEVLGSMEDWFAYVHPSDSERVRSLWKQLETDPRPSFEAEFRCLHQDGSWRWILTRAICQRREDGMLLRVTGSSSDITARKIIDPLTGLHNRTSLILQLQWRIDRQSEHARNFGLLFLDIDSFKRVNDSLGHLKGDALLVEVAGRLEQTVSTHPGSIVSRLGGDEFVVLLGDVESEEDVLTYAAALGYLLETPINCHGQEVFISASIGVAFGLRGRYTEATQMLEDADVAMYRAKINGKAQSATFSQEMREKAIARLELEHDLRVALQARQFELYYQPKVRLASGQVKGFEALIRWRHPQRGMISPGLFIQIAEEIGLINEIGRWVASEAIQQLATWRRTGAVTPETTMAVNISTKQFMQSDLRAFLIAKLDEHGIPPECLALEITESIMVGDVEAANVLLGDLAAAGIGLDLDDFGTGYSSLSYLHRFPFRSVKIDQSFVRRMSVDPESVSLVASIIGLAASLNMGVIAEGIETEAQAQTLRDMGCPVGQGYLFSPPRPPGEIENFLKTRKGPLKAQSAAPLFRFPAPERLPTPRTPNAEGVPAAGGPLSSQRSRIG
jgi:diguanylate cyclase (GGDEF)-like protein/PAS domain S-box-containing protein